MTTNQGNAMAECIVEVAMMGPRRFYTDDQAARAEKGEEVGAPAGRMGYIACIALQKGDEQINMSGGSYSEAEAAEYLLDEAARLHGLKWTGYKIIGPVMPKRVSV